MEFTAVVAVSSANLDILVLFSKQPQYVVSVPGKIRRHPGTCQAEIKKYLILLLLIYFSMLTIYIWLPA